LFYTRTIFLKFFKLAFSIWKRELIIPLASKLVTHIIELIQQIRKMEGTYSAINLADIRGAILSFVEVYFFKRKLK
jgi:hypothetical protein